MAKICPIFIDFATKKKTFEVNQISTKWKNQLQIYPKCVENDICDNKIIPNFWKWPKYWDFQSFKYLVKPNVIACLGNYCWYNLPVFFCYLHDTQAVRAVTYCFLRLIFYTFNNGAVSKYVKWRCFETI